MHQHENHDQWARTVKTFCDRNWARKTRVIEISATGTLEQEHGLPLNGITIERDGNGASCVQIMLGGHTWADSRHLVRTIPNVRRIGIYTPANCCDVLEVEDVDGTTTVLNFGSLTNLGE
jgi:hypothetical protein